MTDLLVEDCAEVHTPARRVPDNELSMLLADLRPAPRRAPELVALRAEALGLVPMPRSTSWISRSWPFLISAGLPVAYLAAAGVLR